MKPTGLIQLVGKLYQAGKVHNLHQVWRFGCVVVVVKKMVIMIIMVMIMAESDDSNNGDNDDS